MSANASNTRATPETAHCCMCIAPTGAQQGFELIARATGMSLRFCSLRCLMEWCLAQMATDTQSVVFPAPVPTVVEAVRTVESEQRRANGKENTRQRSTVAGQMFQLVAPFMSDFPYNPLDCVSLSGPVDWIVYDGLADGQLERLVFLENKLGGSQLSTRQRQVKKVLSDLCTQCKELVCFDVYSRNLPQVAPRRPRAEPA